MIFSVVGGDIRQTFLIASLKGDGHEVRSFALNDGGGSLEECVRGADCVVLPLPSEKPAGNLNAPGLDRAVGISDICRALSPGQRVFAGMPSRRLISEAEKAGAEVFDYAASETFSLTNAALTAEGAIALIIGSVPRSLFSGSVLIAGFGRIGKALAWRLRALGAEVTAAARKERDRAEAESLGCKCADIGFLGNIAGTFDVIVNTVPAGIFGQRELDGLKEGCLFLDLASAPGGIAEGAFYGGAVKAPGLPGRFSPQSAGDAIKSAVYNMLFNGGTL